MPRQLITSAEAAPDAPVPFAVFPVCEVSAAILAHTNGGAASLLVGDNEFRTALFGYDLDGAAPVSRSQQALDFPGGIEISDIEAIAPLGDDGFAVFGSHSRNSACDAKRARRRFLNVRLDGDALEVESELVQSSKITCARLFGDKADDPNIQAVCQAIDSAEESADAIDDEFDDSDGGADAEIRAEAACAEAAPFNLEGAFTADSRTWVGLRSPLVESSNGRQAAVLLRLVDTTAFVFDRAVLLDLGNRGVRESTVDGDTIWGIAGPAADSGVDFVLWKLPLAALASDAVQPDLVRSVPTSSEALWMADGRAHVLIDGDQGDSDSACAQAARYWSAASNPSRFSPGRL